MIPMTDPRAGLAEYYDLSKTFPDDIPFYLAQVQEGQTRVLELGCGTGRVSVALADAAACFVGVDHSPEMATACRRRLKDADLLDKADVQVGDIISLDLTQQFDLIVAPFRVLQNLASDEQVTGFFRTIARHLGDNGRAIINVFCPSDTPANLVALWERQAEDTVWEVATDGGRVTRSDRRARVRKDPLTLYPDFVYRRYRDDELVEELVHSIAMRCYYPDELLDRVAAEGFNVVRTWGGYRGEAYGEGPELIVEFTGGRLTSV